MYAVSHRQRTVSALASVGIVGLGGVALILGLAGKAPLPTTVHETLVALTPTTPMARPLPTSKPSPTPVLAARAETSRQREAASPENLRNRAAAVFAPVLPPLRPPPPVLAAPRVADGSASNTGASDRTGPGQGAGGLGDGTGGGGNGDGNGNGESNAVTRPIQIRGKLRWSDLPVELRERRQGGELELTYRVNIDGRVSDCRITQSSGSPLLDARTCRLITERFRFRPSRDASGRPVPSHIIESHGWEPEGPDVYDDR